MGGGGGSSLVVGSGGLMVESGSLVDEGAGASVDGGTSPPVDVGLFDPGVLRTFVLVAEVVAPVVAGTLPPVIVARYLDTAAVSTPNQSSSK